MKKIIIIILLLLFLPIPVKAEYKISNYRIDITVLENGDVDIIEALQMDGEYNGLERKIKYKGIYEGYKSEYLSSIDDASLYDGKLILNEIRAINYDNNKTMLELKKDGDLFTRVNSANKGEYGLYTIKQRRNKNIYNIYNPNKMNKDLYIDYTLENVVIVHKDVAEMVISLLDRIDQDIDNLEINIHIPNNKTVAKVWVHENEASIDNIDIENIKITIQNIKKNSSLDFRLIFDTNVIESVRKQTEQIVWNTIIEKEEELKNISLEYKDEEYKTKQEEAYNLVSTVEQTKKAADYETALIAVWNLKEEDKLQIELLVRLLNVKPKIERNEVFTKVILTSVMLIWFFGLITLLYQIYKKYNNYPKLVNEFSSVLPNDPPFIIGYLFNHKISNKDLVATILYLNKNKIISIQKKSNDYILKKKETTVLSLEEERLIKILFFDKDELSFNELRQYVVANHEQFLSNYSNWLNSAVEKCEKEQLFEQIGNYKIIGIIYSIIGFIIGMIFIQKDTYFSSYILIVLSMIIALLFLFFEKRTQKGITKYNQWKLFKEHLETSENIEQYLFYSISLGNFEKISKKELSKKNRKIVIFNQEILKNINDIINLAYETKKSVEQ